VKDAKKAKRSAKSAYKNAKSSRSANGNVVTQEKKIAKLTADIKRKEERMQELNSMRTAIYNKIPAQPGY
jgi:small-conductance mechanosensitive channel